eukprot:2512502-Ditylum_brightwellii.AAC.2
MDIKSKARRRADKVDQPQSNKSLTQNVEHLYLGQSENGKRNAIEKYWTEQFILHKESHKDIDWLAPRKARDKKHFNALKWAANRAVECLLTESEMEDRGPGQPQHDRDITAKT